MYNSCIKTFYHVTSTGGRPSLLKVFKNFAATKPGFIFPADIQDVLAQMGVVMSDRECELLIQVTIAAGPIFCFESFILKALTFCKNLQTDSLRNDACIQDRN